jgi:hypothetical protein
MRQKSGNAPFSSLGLADLKSAAVGVIWFVRSASPSGRLGVFCFGKIRDAEANSISSITNDSGH